MDIHDQELSCLSDDPHDDNITDPVLHYFGCLEASERTSFFEPGSSYWTGEIQRHIDAGLPIFTAEYKTEEKRRIWEKECSDELRRISLILGALSKDHRKAHLLKNVDSSRNAWRSLGSQRVPNLRTSKGMRNEAPIDQVKVDSEEVYDPDDLTVSIMAFDNGNGWDIEHPHVTGTFPNQTTTVNDMLREDNIEPFGLLNSTRSRRKPGVVIWFHIPSNNMTEAIACYYGEKRPSRKQMHHENAVSEGARVLREYFWRGQQYGDATNPSSRFMRPFCQFIKPSLIHEEPEAKSIVLFVSTLPAVIRGYDEQQEITYQAPFLHWETSRQLSLFTHKIQETSVSNMVRQRQVEVTRRENRRSERVSRGTDSKASPSKFGSRIAVRRTVQSALAGFRSLGRHSRRNNPLSQYLLDAARLYEELQNYPDTSLIEKYLFSNPPLHPRRTLDQGYHTTLQTTRLRDRNQVVYRATTPIHAKHRVTCSGCPSSWPQCDECASIQKVSQVIMVDQLWMWVLDQKTIITCFPKRYGLRGRDPSGVFEAIQKRRAQGPACSAFEVANAILDECSGTFFDRMKDFSGQPRVLDIFSDAIKNVSKKQTEESHELWDWIDKARRINRSAGTDQDLEIPAWALSAEGHLEREIEDIIEELEIMISILKTQSDVYRKFIRHASYITNGGRSTQEGADGTPLVGSPNSAAQLGSANLMIKVKDRIDYLESLLKTASSTADRVKDLSRLRQQQDSVIQALQSVKLSQDSIDQGRTIMVFTIVTIVFAPLSFLSSIFGMNNAEFGDNQWNIADQLKLIFSISVGVTALTLVLASRRVRFAIIYLAACISNLLATVLRVIGLDSIIDRQNLYDWAAKTIRKTPWRSSARSPSSLEV
ncbi:hypothetical protein F4859DRAFT_510333 [Xylaria cf. heliscus]|nr:hypothetical protein F4859DRAFT_510333 [Xylaria cf. heliscus]